MRFIITLLATLLAIPTYPQIVGVVSEKESGELLSNIPIIITHNNDKHMIYSDSLGLFRSEQVMTGDFCLEVSALGYQAVKINNIIATSGHVKNLRIELIQTVYSIGEVEITHSAWGIDKSNGLSSFEINPNLMNLTVGSTSDIMRSATLIPGVSNTSDASNDLNIRGNSPFGMTWYIEGVPVVSPNHFTDNNSTNGIFSVFDSWGINKAQLFTSAFPVEYSGATSGILNTELRIGNLQKFQGNINFSTINAGAVLETPIKKDKSSIIGGFRYTFPNFIHEIFPSYSERLGTVPDVLDGFFKFHTSINNNLKLSLWAIGGNNNAAFKYTVDNSEKLSFQRSGNSISSGLSLDYYKKTFSLKSNIYTSHRSNHEYVIRRHSIDSRAGWAGFNTKLAIHNDNSKVLLGLDFKRQYYNQYRELAGFVADSINSSLASDFSSFFSYSYYFNNDLVLKGGIRYVYNGIAEKHRIEPRIELRKNVASLGNISLGYSEQSTNIPVNFAYTYELNTNEEGYTTSVNRKKVLLPLMKSSHFVLGWNKSYKGGMHISSELFYQHLYDIIESNFNRGYTNNPYTYGGITLGISETGPYPYTIGRNYGVEASIDAPLTSKKLYLYTAGTIYNSEFKSDQGWFSTLFNSSFSLTAALRKDYLFTKRTKLSTSFNYVAQGGRRYTPADKVLTEQNQKITYDTDRINACKYPNYSRLDASLILSTSGKNLSHTFSVEVQNIFNTENILERYEYYNYDPVTIFQVSRVFVYKYALHF